MKFTKIEIMFFVVFFFIMAVFVFVGIKAQRDGNSAPGLSIFDGDQEVLNSYSRQKIAAELVEQNRLLRKQIELMEKREERK